MVLISGLRCAPRKVPPRPTGPARPPRSAKLLAALLMETVQQDLVFAVSFFNRKICIFNFFVFFLKMLFFCVTRCSCHNHMWKRHFYKHHIHQKRRVCLVICSKKDFQSPFLRYPSTYTPTTTGSCAFTVNKVQDDICQLRLDFQTFTGLAASTTAGSCTDSIAVAGNNLTTIKRHKVKF